ncbi:MAG: hypothetical protein M1812_003229 [Candelaria pacifica]|nr:MAG: hypothetical protein M1812_003229 [Candelaria pacifica]
MKTCTIFAAALAFGLVQSAALDLRSEGDKLSAEGKRDNDGDGGKWHEFAETSLGKVYSNVARDLHNFKREESTTWHEYAVTPLGKVYSNVARDVSPLPFFPHLFSALSSEQPTIIPLISSNQLSDVQDINPDSLSARDSTDDVILTNFLKAHPDIGNDPQAISKYIDTHPDLKAALEASKPHSKRDLIAESGALERRDYQTCIACMALCIIAHAAVPPAGGPVWHTMLFSDHCRATQACGRNQAGRYVNEHFDGTQPLGQ